MYSYVVEKFPVRKNRWRTKKENMLKILFYKATQIKFVLIIQPGCTS